MPSELQYTCDCEFVKLLTRRSEVHLAAAALEIARDRYAHLDFRPSLDWIDARAAELVERTARGGDELGELSRCMAEEHGVFGDADCFDRPDSSYLHRVIETGRGLPISLCVLYMAIARGAGIELKGVSAPGRFLIRYESIEGTLFLDAFAKGRIMTSLECKKWLHDACGVARSSVCAALRPVGPRTIIIRMLTNLKALYLSREEWTAAWNVQHRLAALEPASYTQRRDLALISLHAGRPDNAIDLLESCLQTCPQDEREVLQSHLRDAGRQLALWN